MDKRNTIGGAMRRVLGGLLPLAMAGGALFAMAPAASAAAPSAVQPAAAVSCPPYGPGSCTGTITVTVNYGPNAIITLTFNASGFTCHEVVNISVSNPSRTVGSFQANCPAGSTAAAVGTAPSPYTASVSGTITLPAGYRPGEHAITALGTQSGVVASTSFMLSETSGNIKPCTASASNVQSSGIVLAAAYLSAQCKTALPATAGGPPSAAGGQPSSAGVVGTATPSSASQLPFTGFNAATVAASGAILLGAGGALVMVSRRKRRSAWQ